MRAILTLLDAANDLKVLPRTGWLLAGVAHAESIADHSYGVSLLALALAETVNEDPPAHGLDAPLDLARVAALALLHDLAESRLTDLPQRAALALGIDAKHSAEATILAALLDGLPCTERWLALFDDYTQAASPEARLVRDADKLEMTHQAARYTRAGVTSLAEFLAERPYAFALSFRLHQQILAAFLPQGGA